MTEKKPKKKRTEKYEIPAEMVAAVDLFEKDPLEIAGDEEVKKKIVAYLRWMRENIKAAEKLMERVTEKAAHTKHDAPPENPLDLLGEPKND